MKMKPKYTHVKLDQFFMDKIMVYLYTFSKFKVTVMRSTSNEVNMSSVVAKTSKKVNR